MIVNKRVVKILQHDQIKMRSCGRDYTLDKWNFLFVKMSAAAIIDFTADYLGKFIHDIRSNNDILEEVFAAGAGLWRDRYFKFLKGF